MIPDKIYIIKGAINCDVATEKPMFSDDIEYIRKDALLEWANGKMTIEGATEGIVGGYDLALKDLINRIESL